MTHYVSFKNAVFLNFYVINCVTKIQIFVFVTLWMLWHTVI